MTREELAGYTLLGGYGLMLLGAIKVFGIRRVLAVIFGIVLLAISIAFGTFRGITDRRY